MTRRVPVAVVLVSTFWMLIGFSAALAAVAVVSMWFTMMEGTPELALQGLLPAAIGLAGIVAISGATGLLRGRRWGRILLEVTSWIVLLGAVGVVCFVVFVAAISQSMPVAYLLVFVLQYGAVGAFFGVLVWALRSPTVRGFVAPSPSWPPPIEV